MISRLPATPSPDLTRVEAKGPDKSRAVPRSVERPATPHEGTLTSSTSRLPLRPARTAEPVPGVCRFPFVFALGRSAFDRSLLSGERKKGARVSVPRRVPLSSPGFQDSHGSRRLPGVGKRRDVHVRVGVLHGRPKNVTASGASTTARGGETPRI